MKRLYVFWVILMATFYPLHMVGQTTRKLISERNITDFEKDIIMKSTLVTKINKETKTNWRYQTFNEKCEKYGITGEYNKPNLISNRRYYYAIEAYSICYNKWYLLNYFTQQSYEEVDDQLVYSSNHLELRTRDGVLIDRLLIWKYKFDVYDSINTSYCTTINSEVKILQMWKNRAVYKRIENMPEKERFKEELHPTLPRTCYKILTYTIDSIMGKFSLQPQVETGNLLKEPKDIDFDKDNPLYKYR